MGHKEAFNSPSRSLQCAFNVRVYLQQAFKVPSRVLQGSFREGLSMGAAKGLQVAFKGPSGLQVVFKVPLSDYQCASKGP